MKKLTLLLICIVGSYSVAHAQTIEDFISEQRGDTLVVNTDEEMGYQPNALADLVALDTDAPEGRVYELKQGGTYLVSYQIGLTGDRPLVIAGEDDTPHVSSTNELHPPIIAGTTSGDDEINGGLVLYNTDVTLKNLISGAHSTSGSQGWSYADAQATGLTFTMDNVYMEHTNWIFVASNDYADNSLTVKDSYFVNMNGNGCRRNGGVYDNVSNNTDEIFVENSTHVMGAGMIYKFRSYPVNKVVFNHNTFVNISNAPISTMGYQTDMIVTNNLFVNTNVQAYYQGLDDGETDQDHLPTGIINVDSLTSTVGNTVSNELLPDDYQSADESEWEAMRRILVDRNAAYWSDELGDIAADAVEMHTTFLDTVPNFNEGDEVVNTMMVMNSRTQAMFDNDDDWPGLTSSNWYDDAGAPEFTNDFGLLDMDAGLGIFREFTVASLEDGNSLVMASIRAEGNSAEDEANWAYPDWPIPFDLSYANTAYRYGALGNLPLGDLNWFPERKSVWLENETELYAELESAKDAGTEPTFDELVSNEQTISTPTAIKLDQNYPNPFNPTTQISFTLPQTQEVSLKVYDMLGREVATIVNNERFSQGVNSVTFDAGSLASGMYIYRLTGANVTLSKKMTLIK